MAENGYPPINVWWICHNYDAACVAWGIAVENKVQETDKNGKRKYSLKQVLGETETARGKRRKAKKGSLKDTLTYVGAAEVVVKVGS